MKSKELVEQCTRIHKIFEYKKNKTFSIEKPLELVKIIHYKFTKTTHH